WEFNNTINSLKSVGSVSIVPHRPATVEFQENIQAFLRGEALIIRLLSTVGLCKRGENGNSFFHDVIVPHCDTSVVAMARGLTLIIDRAAFAASVEIGPLLRAIVLPDFQPDAALLRRMVALLEVRPALLPHVRVMDHPPTRPDDRENVPLFGKFIGRLHPVARQGR